MHTYYSPLDKNSSSKFNFEKILDQNSYIPEQNQVKIIRSNLCSGDKAQNVRPWNPPTESSFLKKIYLMVLIISIVETAAGVVLLVLLTLYAKDFDNVFNTADSNIVSMCSFWGLVALTVTGMVLMIGVLAKKQRVMRFYIITSTLLCIYIFVLSIIEIHFALMVIEKDTYRLAARSNNVLLSTACVVGIGTLLGSVIHFVGNVSVFVYYTLKYVQPVIFSCGP